MRISPSALRVLFIEKLMTKLPLWPNIKNGKVRLEESDVARHIDPSIFSFISL
jgi:hypothetical protein